MASPSRASGRSVNVAQLISLFLAFLLVAGVGGVLASGFLMPMVAAIGATTSAGAATFDDLDTEIGSMTLSERSTIQYSDGSRMATFYAEDRIVVPQDEISQYIQDAVVATEDKRFFEHGAIDPEGMLRAVIVTLSGSGFQGGSTLTQQYVKNVLLEQGRSTGDSEAMFDATAPTIGRKLREAKLAIALEQRYSKDEILTGYLNIAQFGPSQYGVEAAARFFFSTSAKDVTLAQAAMLARITQAPGKWDPRTQPENAKDGRDTVLDLMLEQGYITQAEYDEAIATPIEDMLDVQRIPPTCATAAKSAYFCQYVVQTILQSPEFGDTRDERLNLLTRGGLTIRTTLNRDLQDEGYQALTDAVPVDDESGISNAMSTVEPGSGRILAMVQNTPYGKPGDDPDAPARITELNFNVDQSHGGGEGFQTGSSFKPFILAAWLEAGHSLYDMVDASQGQHFSRSSWNYDGCLDLADDYDPKNIEGIGSGYMRALDITIDSVNTGYVNMENQLNMCDVLDLTQRLGLHVGTGETLNGLPIDNNPAMVLGANFVAPLTMAAAFATFASNGIYCHPIAIDSVTDSNGESMDIPDAGCDRALSEKVAATVTYALTQVVESNRRNATGNNARIPGFDVAGKTGTANEDYTAWFVGFVPQMVTAVFNGHSEGSKSMAYQRINGQWYGQVYGGNFAAPIWRQYMTGAISLLDLEPQSFPEPDDKLVYGEQKWIPSVAGMSVEQATEMLERAGFRVSVGEAEESDTVPEGAVVRTNPEAGRLLTQGSVVTLITSSGPPPPPEPDPTTPPENGDGEGGGDNGGGPGGPGGGGPGGPGGGGDQPPGGDDR